MLPELFEAAWTPVASISLDSPIVTSEPVVTLASVSSQFDSPTNDKARNLHSVVTTLVAKWFLEIIYSPVFGADTPLEGALDALLIKLQALIIHFNNKIIDYPEITKV